MSTNNEILESLRERREEEALIITETGSTENINEMATIGRDQQNNFCVVVNPDSGRSDAYFKLCDHQSYDSCENILCISFFGLEAFDHKDGKGFWQADKKILKALIKFLKSKPKSPKDAGYATNWEKAVYLWNIECGHDTDKDWDEEYPEGCMPGSGLFKKSNFVPLNKSMPDYDKIDFKKIKRREK